MFTAVNDKITELLGPLGLIIIVGVLGASLVLLTVLMMVRQPEDPLEKLKRNSTKQSKATTRHACATPMKTSNFRSLPSSLNPKTWRNCRRCS